ncbi:MAG: copper chaperone PCu(A)C [Anaerolineae bacterium]|nr:copper chaperone PCu(A)C [Anaerolineae bacterium]
MKYRWLYVFLILGLFISSAPALAQSDETACKLVSLFSGWARSTPEGAPNGAAFGFVVNLSSEEDTLVGASTDAAEIVEVHEMVVGENDVMQMRPIEGGLVIAPNRYQELRPGGYHIMLINLKAPLEAGKFLDLVLHFKSAGDVPVQVPIRDMTEMDEPMSGGMDSMAPAMEPTPQSSTEWDAACQNMYVLNAWARPAGAGMPSSAAYALLLNLTEQDDILTSASTEIAKTVELHEMSMGEGDVMQMRPVEGGIAVPKGAAVVLQPGGLHIMLMELNNTVEVGDMVNLTLTFAESGEMQLTIPVQEPPEAGMSPMTMESSG